MMPFFIPFVGNDAIRPRMAGYSVTKDSPSPPKLQTSSSPKIQIYVGTLIRSEREKCEEGRFYIECVILI